MILNETLNIMEFKKEIHNPETGTFIKITVRRSIFKRPESGSCNIR